MDGWQRVLRPCVAILFGGAFLMACADGPTETPLRETTDLPSQRILAAISCAADIWEGSLTCESARPATAEHGPRFLIVGGQGKFVTLASTEVSYNPNKALFRAVVTVTNRIHQPLGTLDGVTPTGVKVFFHVPAHATSGSGDITLVDGGDGTGDFTGSSQQYYEYLEIITHESLSAQKKWEWIIPTSVLTFAFQVYVAADVQYVDGFVDVGPPTATVAAGGTVDLSAVVRDVVGQDTGGGVMWSSNDTKVATVAVDPAFPDGLHAIVTGVSAGTAIITASSGGAEADGTAEITVTG